LSKKPAPPRLSPEKAVAELQSRVKTSRARAVACSRLEAAWEKLHDRTGAQALNLMTRWLRAQVDRVGAQGCVLGASGGVDSSLVAVLMARALPRRCHALILPCNSDARDEADARALLDLLRIPYRVSPIHDAVDALVRVLFPDGKVPPLARGNVTSRVRNAVMYLDAQTTGCLVLGTGNLDETYLGYSSKGTTADLFPITGLHKDEVRALLRTALEELDPSLAERIIRRPPSPGYWPGQEAEEELGITYRRVGPALDVIIGQCDISLAGVEPRDPQRMAQLMGDLGVPGGDVLHVAQLVSRNQHKAFGSPALWRPEPLAGGSSVDE
jgi:NAD+ synthase